MLVAKLLQLLNFLSLSNDQNPAKSRHRPFEQSLFLFGQVFVFFMGDTFGFLILAWVFAPDFFYGVLFVAHMF